MTRDPTTRFDDRVDAYVRTRPSYPSEAIDAVLDGLGEPADLVAADVGAGTGISARLLGDRGVRVLAVEPNEPMRAGADPHEGVEWRDGTAESIGLGDDSVDLVLCAQSYHWFEPPRACAEFGRILRPGGRLALMWNDGDESTPVARAYYDAVRAVATDSTLSHKVVAAGPTVCAPFGEPRVTSFVNEQRLDLEGLIGRAMSASYVPKSGEKHEWLIGELTRMHSEHAEGDGCVSFVYRTIVYLSGSEKSES